MGFHIMHPNILRWLVNKSKGRRGIRNEIVPRLTTTALECLHSAAAVFTDRRLVHHTLLLHLVCVERNSIAALPAGQG